MAELEQKIKFLKQKIIFILKEQKTIQFMVSSISFRAKQKLLVHLEIDSSLSLRVTDEQITRSYKSIF
jgi:hypothetical protein